jgi:hypothetical protein
LISVKRLTGGGKLKQLRAQLGNDIAIRAFREGKIGDPSARRIELTPIGAAIAAEEATLLLRPVSSACREHLFLPNFAVVSDARIHQVEYLSLIGHPFIVGDPTVSIGVDLSRQFRAI